MYIGIVYCTKGGKEGKREGGRKSGKEGRREGRKEGGREKEREGKKEGGRKKEREGRKEEGREKEREGGKEGGREKEREGRREEIRDGRKEERKERGPSSYSFFYHEISFYASVKPIATFSLRREQARGRQHTIRWHKLVKRYRYTDHKYYNCPAY